MSGNGILPMSMSTTAAAGNDRPLGAKKRARGADRSPAPAPLSPRNASDHAAAWHASLVGGADDEGARPSKRMLRQVECLPFTSSKDATTGRAAPSRASAPAPASAEAPTTSASATASGATSTFVLDSDPTSAFTTSSPCGLRCGADARTPLPRSSSATDACDALNARTAARPPSTGAAVAPVRPIVQQKEKEKEDEDEDEDEEEEEQEEEEGGGARAQAQAAPRTPRPQLSVDFDPLDEQRKLMRDFVRAKAASPECKLPRSVTPQAVDEALQEEEEEEDDEDEEWDAGGQEQEHDAQEDEELDRRHVPTLRYQTLMGTHDRAASTAGVHYFEMLIEQPSALMLVGVARPKLRNEFDSRTAGADADACGSAGEGAGAGAAARPSTPVADTSFSAAQQEQSPLKAFRSQHAFQLHTATGDRWHAGRPCAPSPTLEPEPAPAAPTSNSAAPVRRCIGVTADAVQGSGKVAGMTAKELEILDEAGLLAEPEPRFQKGDRVGVLVEIDGNAPVTSTCGGAGEGTAKAKRARVSFTRNGRTLRKVGAFEDIAVEDGFVPVVDVALGGRVRFVDWKHFV